MPHQSLQRVKSAGTEIDGQMILLWRHALRQVSDQQQIMKREHWLYLAAAVCGAAIWILITLASGRNEAWDSGLYFSVGIPAVCLVSMAFAHSLNPIAHGGGASCRWSDSLFGCSFHRDPAIYCRLE